MRRLQGRKGHIVAGPEKDPDDLAQQAFFITMGGVLSFVAVVFIFIL